jgi:hypothetical protein
VDLSEAMAFGLGAGLWFVMLDGTQLSPSTMFFGRSMTYESDLCRTLGVAFDDRSTTTFDEAWTELRGYVREGRPPLLVTDIKHLPHYGTSTHFNATVSCWPATTMRPGPRSSRTRTSLACAKCPSQI